MGRDGKDVLTPWTGDYRDYRKVDGLRVPFGNEVSWQVTLVYSSDDWSTSSNRERTFQAIPGAELITVEGAGHLLSRESPQRVWSIILAPPSKNRAIAAPPNISVERKPEAEGR